MGTGVASSSDVYLMSLTSLNKSDKSLSDMPLRLMSKNRMSKRKRALSRGFSKPSRVR